MPTTTGGKKVMILMRDGAEPPIVILLKLLNANFWMVFTTFIIFHIYLAEFFSTSASLVRALPTLTV